MSPVPVLSEEEALATARTLGTELAGGAAERDAQRRLPFEEVLHLARSGLLAITVPAEYGGAGVSIETLTEVIRLLSWGDPNVGQIPQSHFFYLFLLRGEGSPESQKRIFTEILEGKIVANAQAEFGTKHVRDVRTALTTDDGGWRLDGEKFYCTGSLFADYLAVLTRLGPEGPLRVAWTRAEADGVEIADDWNALGQRTTGSGTVKLSGVRIDEDWITPYDGIYDRPGLYGAFAQLLHSAIDAGIARRAVQDAAAFAGSKSRPYPDANVERAVEDPVVVQAFGEIELSVRSAEALLAHAARTLDRIAAAAAGAELRAEDAADASLAVAAARVATGSAAVTASSRLFEVCGTRSALTSAHLDRHWRNARTHTLHDPAGWKLHHLGRWAAAGTLPPRHGQI